MGHTRRDDVAQTSPMEELAHDLLTTENRSCGSLGPTMGRSSSTASGHGDRGERLLPLELALVFLEEERVMQHSSVSISLSF